MVDPNIDNKETSNISKEPLIDKASGRKESLMDKDQGGKEEVSKDISKLVSKDQQPPPKDENSKEEPKQSEKWR